MEEGSQQLGHIGGVGCGDPEWAQGGGLWGRLGGRGELPGAGGALPERGGGVGREDQVGGRGVIAEGPFLKKAGTLNPHFMGSPGKCGLLPRLKL
jgi:hypothetical protein